MSANAQINRNQYQSRDPRYTQSMQSNQSYQSQGYPPSYGYGYGQPQQPYGFRQPSVGSYGYPQHASYASQGGHYQPYGGSTIGGRSHSKNSLVGTSKSLGASKASIASRGSGKTSIQQEYHDKQVKEGLSSPLFGKGRTPFLIAIALFVLAGLFILSGIIVLILRFHGNIMLSIDKGEFVGPALIAVGALLIGGAVKFMYDAYKISGSERRKLKFTAASESMVSVNTLGAAKRKDPGDTVMSGSSTANALTRTPHGSRNTLTAV